MDYTVDQIQVHSGVMPVKLIFGYGVWKNQAQESLIGTITLLCSEPS